MFPDSLFSLLSQFFPFPSKFTFPNVAELIPKTGFIQDKFASLSVAVVNPHSAVSDISQFLIDPHSEDLSLFSVLSTFCSYLTDCLSCSILNLLCCKA